jgi:hypothetical protein
LPGFLSVVVQAALGQLPPLLAVQGPAGTMPAICKRPGKPVNFPHVPPYDTAVNALTIATAATIKTTDAGKILLILRE